jgi:hypothetical protein
MKINVSTAVSRQDRDFADKALVDRGSPRLATLELRIAPARIHYLKFILEGYDGWAVLSTVEPRQGLVRLRFPEEMKGDVLALLRDLSPQVGGVDWFDVIPEV